MSGKPKLDPPAGGLFDVPDPVGFSPQAIQPRCTRRPKKAHPAAVTALFEDPHGYRIKLVQTAAYGAVGGVKTERRMQLSNYLFFTMHCEQALAFYTECGLGMVTEVLRYGEDGMPTGGKAMRGRVMHARFEGPGVLFYASDNDDAEPMRGSAHILMMDDRADTERLFYKLAEDGGVITTALGIQPWGDFYGKITDRFGVQWMLNCQSDQ